MLQGIEYIPFDFADPAKGQVLLRIAPQRLIKSQAAKTQRDVALVLLALDS
jgi:hypothetical protein